LAGRLLELLSPKSDGLYLDIGCGTGNYTNEFAQKGFSLIGIDPSAEMLNTAKAQNCNIDWRFGSAAETGLADESIDGIIACLTIHHWPDLFEAFQELHRILKSGGKIIVFTSTPEQTSGYWLEHYFPKMISAASKQLPALEIVGDAMAASELSITGLENYSVLPDLEDLFLYSGKHNPNLYFDEQFRKGISTFADLADSEEVNMGLKKLRGDIDSGKVNEIIKSYQNDIGDYLFINAVKIKHGHQTDL